MAKKQAALGRGLGALLNNGGGTLPERKAPSAPSTPREPEVIGNMAGQIAVVAIAQIEANPDQPRKDFDETALHELADSIAELGIIQPITVHKTRANRYQIISGERRFRASQIAGLTEVPVYIREVNDQTLLEMALVENIQREDLHAIEVAMTLQRLLDECDLTQEELGKRVGKNRSTIANHLRLLKLPGDIQIAVANKEISMGHARALLAFSDAKQQVRICRQIIEEELSVRQVEAMSHSTSNRPGSGRSKPVLSFDERKVDEDLRKQFGRHAALKSKGDGSGKIEIAYADAEDLHRILQFMNL